MTGTFALGEKKVRPGAYFNIQKDVEEDISYDGVTAVVFRSDFGPLNKVVELNPKDGYEKTFGTGLTTDAIREAFAGGARYVIACRAGSGGTPGTISLKNADGEDAVTISVKYPGEKEFAAKIREKLSGSGQKECIFYDGMNEIEKYVFKSGEMEAQALVEAMGASNVFDAVLADGKENAVLADVSQNSFVKGTNPAATMEDYSNAFAQMEPYEFNTICVDTEDPGVHKLLQSFLNRVYEAGTLAQAVVAEKHTVGLEERMEHAASFDDEKINYVLNAFVDEQGKEIDGYQTAARVAGMIGAMPSNTSLTHTVIPGFTDILEKLSNTGITAAEEKGCIVLSLNKKKQVWADNAVNTLNTLAENQDEGWKKIRRVKTRYELIRRINEVCDNLAGKVDNDKNGWETTLGQIQGVGDEMKEEGKLTSFSAKLSTTYPPDADSAWYEYDIVDKDSTEHIYGTFRFRYGTNEE